MSKRNTLTPRHHLHSLDRCVWCGARDHLYTTYLAVTESMAAQCEDPIRCLKRRKKKALNG